MTVMTSQELKFYLQSKCLICLCNWTFKRKVNWHFFLLSIHYTWLMVKRFMSSFSVGISSRNHFLFELIVIAINFLIIWMSIAHSRIQNTGCVVTDWWCTWKRIFLIWCFANLLIILSRFGSMSCISWS